ncbi:tail protein [Bacillus phage BalMu-1]|nr:tail protein [Bacillus phage BalMu-1]AJA42476.1 XkdQ [Bacillus phage BalMu-1]
MSDSLSQIAYQADVSLVVTDELAKIGIDNGQEIRVSGTPFGKTNMVHLLHPGVVWDLDSVTTGTKDLRVTIYDRTIFLQESEDEYYFPSGRTASQRLRKYASDWGIPLSRVPDTRVSLAKTVYRPQSLWSMIESDLKETVKKGGAMYRARMTPSGLELFEIGSNSRVWILESGQNIIEVGQNRTLQGAVTRVKVVGKAEDGQRSPLITTVSGDVAKYGTLQKVLQDDKITTVTQGRTAARDMLRGVEETFRVVALDINEIRAGDTVELNKKNLIVTSVSRTLGSPGEMSLSLASKNYVKRRFYLE